MMIELIRAKIQRMGGIILKKYSGDCTHLLIQYQIGKFYQHVSDGCKSG